MKKYAKRGKSTKGYHYGFKLQGVCTKNGTLLKIMFRSSNENDSQPFDDVTKGLEGVFVTDTDYLLDKETLKNV